MNTIKTVSALVGAATLLAAPCAFAQTLNITAPGYSLNGNQAGPYTVQIIGPSTIGAIYTGVDAQPLTYPNASVAFQTFCIASTVDYYPGSTYNYQASTVVQPFAGETPPPTGTSETYVTWGVAYLYNQYLKNPGGFGGPGNTVQADALQEAIWTLQDQPFASGISLGGVTQSQVNPYLAADLTLASTEATAYGQSSDTNNANGAFGVEALNMYTGSGSSSSDYAQPQLVDLANGSQGSPVPEPSTVFAGVLMLIPLGVSAVRILRKKGTV